MNLQSVHSDEANDRSVELSKRRTVLAHAYDTLPAYGSAAFWQTIEEPDMSQALPLELLVYYTRLALTHGDHEGRNRILEVIFCRIATTNEYWANSVLKTTFLSADERKALVNDLYADLCERVIRAIVDPTRLFWEENFQHSLMFERKHVYISFMKREGRWHHQNGRKSERIPRTLIESLDQLIQLVHSELHEPHIEDELAQKALLTIEHTDLSRLILHLPDKLKSVVLLIFWEGKTEKDTAKVLGITDRTVRNRLCDALKILHRKLEAERKYIYG